MSVCSHLYVINGTWFFSGHCHASWECLVIYFLSVTAQVFWQNHRSELSCRTVLSQIGQIILETVFVSFESIVIKFLCILSYSNFYLIYLCSLVLVQSFPCFQWLLQRTELEVSSCLRSSMYKAWLCSPHIISFFFFFLLFKLAKIFLDLWYNRQVLFFVLVCFLSNFLIVPRSSDYFHCLSVTIVFIFLDA